MAEGTIYHRVDSELCSQSEHGICDRRLVDFSHTPGSHVKPTTARKRSSNGGQQKTTARLYTSHDLNPFPGPSGV